MPRSKIRELFDYSDISGCSAVRLAHLLWEQGVVGSNPATPTRENQGVTIKRSSFFVVRIRRFNRVFFWQYILCRRLTKSQLIHNNMHVNQLTNFVLFKGYPLFIIGITFFTHLFFQSLSLSMSMRLKLVSKVSSQKLVSFTSYS